MKTLKTIYKAKLVRYNLGESALAHYKEFNYYPTENELLIFLVECNKDTFADFDTTISVEKIYLVIDKKKTPFEESFKPKPDSNPKAFK